MKKIVGLSLLAILSMAFVINRNIGISPESGIKFEHISLKKAKEEAEKSGKIIFIDCYTSWCGPCKQMAATSFKDEGVAKIYNEKFVNLKVDIEKDPDGPELARMYKISAYPTLLYINSEGKLIKTVIGMQSADKLISIANSIN